MNAPATPAKTGKILLVGLGPGSHDHLTDRARAAIAEADTVIGYVTYIRLVAELLDGKEVIKKSMTEELDRAIEAYARAREGKTVALISSGDAGVYGMAGPTFEVGDRGRDRSRRLGDQHLRRAGRRAADPRFLRHLALRPAHPVADHRPPA